MKLVVPVSGSVPGQGSRRRTDAGRLRGTDFWWTLEDKYPLAKMFVEAFEKKYGYKPEWGANNAYMQFAMWADAWSSAPAASIRRT
jgi:branched-chain amino acid transport system substrate-binding protein